GDELETAETESLEVPAKLQISIPPQNAASAEVATSDELPLSDDLAEGPPSLPSDPASDTKGSTADVTTEELTSVVTEASSQVIVSPLHRGSNASTSTASHEESDPIQDARSKKGGIAIPEEFTTEATLANGGFADPDSLGETPSEAELPLRSSAGDLEIAANASELNPAIERSEGASTEPRSSEAR